MPIITIAFKQWLLIATELKENTYLQSRGKRKTGERKNAFIILASTYGK